MGVTLGRRNNWEKYFAEVTATRSSKPESVAKEIAEKQKDREAQAHFLPVAGVVSSCVILDINGDVVFNSGGSFESSPGKISYEAMQLITNTWTNTAIPVANDLDELGYRLYGLRIRDRLRIMALDALHYAHSNKVSVKDILPGLWYNRPFEASMWCDPYDMIIPSQNRNDISFDGLSEFLRFPLPNIDFDSDPQLQAEIARELAIRANLIKAEA